MTRCDYIHLLKVNGIKRRFKKQVQKLQIVLASKAFSFDPLLFNFRMNVV